MARQLYEQGIPSSLVKGLRSEATIKPSPILAACQYYRREGELPGICFSFPWFRNPDVDETGRLTTTAGTFFRPYWAEPGI